MSETGPTLAVQVEPGGPSRQGAAKRRPRPPKATKPTASSAGAAATGSQTPPVAGTSTAPSTEGASQQQQRPNRPRPRQNGEGGGAATPPVSGQHQPQDGSARSQRTGQRPQKNARRDQRTDASLAAGNGEPTASNGAQQRPSAEPETAALLSSSAGAAAGSRPESRNSNASAQRSAKGKQRKQPRPNGNNNAGPSRLPGGEDGTTSQQLDGATLQPPRAGRNANGKQQRNARNPAGQGAAGRRGRFDGGLTGPSSSTHQHEHISPSTAISNGSATKASLSALAPSFSPSASTSMSRSGSSGAEAVEPPAAYVPPPVTLAPGGDTLLHRLSDTLSSGNYDCPICFSAIGRQAAISSCGVCFSAFHLSCISTWANRSLADAAAKRATAAPGTAAASTEEVWRCPSCQNKKTEVPKVYTCFCGKRENPLPRPGGRGVPHSCGTACGRDRPIGCNHPCPAGECHPGPCPPCAVVLDEQCHCTKKNLVVRCSTIHNKITDEFILSAASAAGESIKNPVVEEALSCRQACGTELGCGMHACAKTCHSGECGACDLEREKKCYCGESTKTEECGSGKAAMTCQEGEMSWRGEWSCDHVRTLKYDCGDHTHEQSCEPTTTSGPLPCPFSPATVSTCPCGQTPLEALLPAARTKCTDKIPVCPLTCGKRRAACGHACESGCHAGDCAPCAKQIVTPCRCGRSSTTRKCFEVHDPTMATEEFTCERVCRAMRSCGRHQCGRRCCPLSFQEAEQAKAKRGSNRRRGVFDDPSGGSEEDVLRDPDGLHDCDRICSKPLACGLHQCQRKDHKGPCPPCLEASFDELICHCRSTIVLPPIPCNFKLVCRHPCVRPSTCGHPRVSHTCHEEEECPPCPFLVKKACACGKKQIANVRCSQDTRKVSCGQACGKLLGCGFHTCRKPCHPAGECEPSCEQTCLKPKAHCSHPCRDKCHAPSACASDEPCPDMIELSCECGLLKQMSKCSSRDEKPEGNRTKSLKCADSCAVAKRNKALADALGLEGKDTSNVLHVDYEPELLDFYAQNTAWSTSIEATLISTVKGDKPTVHLPAMKRPQRTFVHELAEKFGLRSESLDEEPHRSVVVHRTTKSVVPTPTLAEAYEAYRKATASAITFGPVRKQPRELMKPNALFLETLFGATEEGLPRLLTPIMRGLKYELNWVGSDNLVIAFPEPRPANFEGQLKQVESSLEHLLETSEISAVLFPATITAEGEVIRGTGWSQRSKGWIPRRTIEQPRGAVLPASANVFAALDKGAKVATGLHLSLPSDSVLTNGLNKAPLAVHAPFSATHSYERSTSPAVYLPTAGGSAAASTTPVVKPTRPDEEIPDDWDEGTTTESATVDDSNESTNEAS